MNKRNRIQNPALLRSLHGQKCQIESCRKPGEVHHIIPRSRLGPDLPFNLMTLCSHHHIGEWHGKGIPFMLETYPELLPFLEKRGFEWWPTFDGSGKLIPPEWESE